MANMKITAFLLLIVLLLGCTRENIEDGDGLPYYEFTTAEKDQLVLVPQVGDEIVFKNQDLEILKFVVGSSITGKTTYTKWSSGFWGPSYATDRFHYDSQKIEYLSTDHYANDMYRINIMKYPINRNYNAYPPITGTPKFYGYFTFPLWNGYRDTDPMLNSIEIDFNTPTNSMFFNGKTYSNVSVYFSNRTEVLNPSNSIPDHPRNVHIIYYDYHYGIIGFDDLNGKNWRLE